MSSVRDSIETVVTVAIYLVTSHWLMNRWETGVGPGLAIIVAFVITIVLMTVWILIRCIVPVFWEHRREIPTLIRDILKGS